jgi:hypothetical protein
MVNVEDTVYDLRQQVDTLTALLTEMQAAVNNNQVELQAAVKAAVNNNQVAVIANVSEKLRQDRATVVQQVTRSILTQQQQDAAALDARALQQTFMTPEPSPDAAPSSGRHFSPSPDAAPSSGGRGAAPLSGRGAA